VNKVQETKLGDHAKKLDREVRARDYDAAIKTMTELLRAVEQAKDGFAGPVASGAATEREATIAASAITSMLADPEYKLNKESFGIFTQFHRAMIQVFEISGYRGTEHFLGAIGERDEKGSFKFKGFEIPKLFAGLSINMLSKPILQLLLKQQPEMSWPLVVGYLSEQILWNQQAEVARSEILKSGETWMSVKPTLNMVRHIGPAYMGCSYAHAPHKHDIKKVMNHITRGYLVGRGVSDVELPGARRAVRRRPTLVVVAELYDSKHAMHRCYGPSIQSLKKKFKTIYFSTDGKCDEALEPIFDKVDNTPFKVGTPETFINKIKSYRPDIEYFPRIDMRLPSILAANVRMAPIQMMTFGHPATTLSEHIGYAVLDAEQIGDPKTVNETILCRKSVPRFEMRHDADDITPLVRAKPPVVRIAVPAWSRKVTPAFLEMCSRINKETSRKVEFWFFPNGSGPLYQAFKRRIEGMLPAKVWPRAGYNRYIQWLNNCDIFFSTVPFGATNGIVDAMRQGMPIVNMTGGEVHAATDSHLVQRFDQPDWLTTQNADEFIAAAKKLIDDDQLRVDISQKILAGNPDEKLLADDNSDALGFVEVFQAAYRHHERIQSARQDDGKQMWGYDELCALLEEDGGA
jgi:hypothetical protein